LNSAEAVLLLPAASVNVSAATLIVQAPSPVGVNVAVYVVPEPVKPEIEPFVTVMSAAAKFVVISEDVNVNESDASDDDPPSATSVAVMVIVGGVASYVQLNSSEAVLLLPAASVNVLPATLIVQAPSPAGMNVAVYVVPEPAKPEIEPFVTVMSDAAKSVVISEDVNVNESDTSDDDPPSATSEAVMVIVGGVAS
jgi:hypothetical protein